MNLHELAVISIISAASLLPLAIAIYLMTKGWPFGRAAAKKSVRRKT